MSAAFREPTPEEVRLATIQFIGQNLGALKDLDSRLIDKNQTLQGMTLNPQAVVKTIPVERQSVAVPIHRPVNNNQPAPSHHPVVPRAVVTDLPQDFSISADPNQLTFDFDGSPTADRIYKLVDKLFLKVESLESKVEKILKKLDS